MSSELESLKQRITELEAKNGKLEAEKVKIRADYETEIAVLKEENAKISELKKENTDFRIKLSISDAEIAELKRRNAETLRANEEYNEMRDAKEKKLEQKNAELEAKIKEMESEFRDRITKVEQNQSLIDNSSNNTSSNFNSVADQLPMVTHHEKPLVDDTSLPEEPIPEVLPEISASNNNAVIKSLEDKKTDSFLDGVLKENVSDGIRQRNREKKLLRESSTKDLSVSKGPASSVDKESRPHKKKEAENIVQDVFDLTMDGSEKNHMTEISLTGREENNCQEKIESQESLAELSSSDVLQNINRLYENACTAENERVKANQAEILCWRNFIIGLDNSIDEIMIKEKVGTKKAKGLIYDFILAHNPDTKRKTLYQRISRARKVYEFTEKIGIDKIKYIKTYSANSIAELSDSQIQTIVDYFSKNPNTELLDDQDVSDIDSEEEISDDQINTSEAVSAEVSESTAPIPLTHDSGSQERPPSNSSDDSKEVSPSNPLEAEDDYYKMLLGDYANDCVYFDKEVDSTPQSVKETNEEEMPDDSPKAVVTPIPQASKTNPTYDRADETSCPLCKLDHDDEEGIEGRYEARSYFIKCEQREIEIVA